MPSDGAVTTREFDLQPHPRILPMLGEITLQPWQCLAELIDNSLDAFITAAREGHAIPEPEIHVTLPSRPDRDAKIVVRDNGPGMDVSTLENAVRAGWTGNDPIDHLGMFGMGFNIATARLGWLTRVWTTRAGDLEWQGLEIDFEMLMRQRHYRTPLLTRPKPDPETQGTEISIERLKPDQAAAIARTANQTRIRKALERVYSSMLRPNGVPIGMRLTLNGTAIRGRQHCTWGGPGNPDRTVPHSRFGEVSSYYPVDVPLANRRFCTACWQWLRVDEEVCPACGVAESVVERVRRVRGWLGIKRYFDENDFGIDLVRHGRKIEVGIHDLFMWDRGEGGAEREYPIDDPRGRGRIVGEIHLDHCRVTYTKDRFDRNDPAWEEMVRIVRGEGPLRPDKAAASGYGPNESPLFKLFQAFRRSSPKTKSAGCYANLLLVPDHDRAKEMGQRFHAGEADYQPDAKWWELVEEADRALLTTDGSSGGSSSGPGASSSGGSATNFWGDDSSAADAGEEATADSSESDSTEPPPPVREPNLALTREYRDEITNQRWDVRAFSVQGTHPELSPAGSAWRLRRTAAGTWEFLFDPAHALFQSATMTPLDALLAELSWSAMDFVRGQTTTGTFRTILTGLRERYAGTLKLDPVLLSSEASATLKAIARSVSRQVDSEDSRSLFEEIPPADRRAILSRLATAAGADAARIIEEGRFLEYAPRQTLLTFFARHPELFFDGRYWNLPHESLDLGDSQVTEEARLALVSRFECLIRDAVWLAEQDADDLLEAGRSRLLRAALALELLSAELAVIEE